VLDEHTLNQVKTIAEEAGMEHINLKAATNTAVVVDQGVFEAVISTESVDREKDIVSATAMVKALKKWNRPIPLAWHHSTKAEDIFGSIDPTTVRAVDGEVVAQGRVHLDSDVGAEAWRSFKAGTIGFSFGYIALGATERTGGGRHITELDVFEITATATPMNNDTRVLSVKGLGPEHDVGVKARDLRLGALLATRKCEPEPAVKAARPPIQIVSFDA
jgi:HK97 family phage prohead protease